MTLAAAVEAVEPPDRPTQRQHARIDAVWDLEEASRAEPARLTPWPRSYRPSPASPRDPALAEAVALRFVRVTGLVTWEGAVVLGRRADYLAADPALWEPAPSGGLHRPDPVGVRLEELREELGLEPETVEWPVLFALVMDARTGIVDICLRAPARLSAEALLARQRDSGTDEHAEVRAVPVNGLPAFVATHARRVIAPLPEMLRASGLLSAQVALTGGRCGETRIPSV